MNVKNFAGSTVATAPSPATTGTSLVLATGGGALMPATPFAYTVGPPGVEPTAAIAEVGVCTNVTGDTCTLVRATESPFTARAILVGDVFKATITAKVLTDLAAMGATQCFRGLRLRTHPDADKAANQVMMPGCDEIVTDLGTHVTPRVALTADITASGAGGLDTGARAASAWYEIYYGYKGPTASAPDTPTAPTADCIFLHRAKNHGLDQSSTTTGAGGGINSAAGQQQVGMRFTAGVSGLMEFIDIALFRTGAPTGNLRFKVFTDTPGLPGAAVAATAISDAIDVSPIATSSQVIRIPFRTPFSVVATTKYWLVAVPSYATSGTNYVNWDGGAGGGNDAIYNGTTWSALGAKNFYFKTYVTQNVAAVTMPAGYTEKCLIGYAYNSSGNALVAFIGQDRQVNYLSTAGVNIVNASSATTQTLWDISALVPPRPVRTILDASSDTVGALVQWSGVPDGYAGSSFRAFITANSSGRSYYLGPSVQTEYQGIYASCSAGPFSGNMDGFIW